LAANAEPAWHELIERVPRAAFIPDTIWVDDPDGPGFVAVARRAEPSRWHAEVAANEPVVTQVVVEDGETFPSSSSSQPSIVADALDPRPGDTVLEIGTGTGWNAALLAHRVSPGGRVVTIEIDPDLAQAARNALAEAGLPVDVISGDGVLGHRAAAPYDRIVATASVREVVPRAWLEQLRTGGRLVTPWGTDYGNGALLTLDVDASGTATGRFTGNVSFMRLRCHQRGLFGWEPDEATIATAETSTTDCRGPDLDRMFNPAKGQFAIGARLPTVAVVVDWDKHLIELDDLTTRSFARVEADVGDPAPFTVRQLGPRRLWDEAVDAYDWWHDNGEPGPDRLGMTITPDRQVVWLDDPTTVIRTWDLDPRARSTNQV
jgi:protein-L-isoaspartate(D-aspartate) O-methyltransferase